MGHTRSSRARLNPNAATPTAEGFLSTPKIVAFNRRDRLSNEGRWPRDPGSVRQTAECLGQKDARTACWIQHSRLVGGVPGNQLVEHQVDDVARRVVGRIDPLTRLQELLVDRADQLGAE